MESRGNWLGGGGCYSWPSGTVQVVGAIASLAVQYRWRVLASLAVQYRWGEL